MLGDAKAWEQRWQALQDTMQAIEQALPSDTPRRQTVQRLLEGLQALAGGQLQYFLAARPPAPHSSHYALSLILRQACDDVEVIERAAHQRIAGAPERREALERADELACQALQPVVGRLLPEITVLTYFQKTRAVRVLPYTPVALIGVPYTSVNFPRDYLAIPHEAGHYLFWRGILPEGEDEGLHIYNALRKRLPKRAPHHSDRLRHWVEEVFADVYGCMIAGPVLALDFQDLQLNHSPVAWTRDDGRHPPPALRPYIYLRTLEKMRLTDWAVSLRERWQAVLAKAADQANLPLVEAGMSSRLGELNVLVDIAYELLEDSALRSGHSWQTIGLPEAPPQADGLQTLYDVFERRLNSLQLPEPTADHLALRGGEEGANSNLEARELRKRFVAEERRVRHALGQAEADWLAVLRAEGWARGSFDTI